MNETSVCINRVYVLTFSPERAAWIMSKLSPPSTVYYIPADFWELTKLAFVLTSERLKESALYITERKHLS